MRDDKPTDLIDIHFLPSASSTFATDIARGFAMFQKTVTVFLFFAVTLLADEPPKPGTFYKYGELGIRQTEVKAPLIHLTFKPKDEQFHWCPGIKVQVTKKATVVTFVRTKTSKSAHVDKKAAFGRKLTRTITIDTKGQDTYVRNGAKDFKKIYSAPEKKQTKKKTTPSKKKTTKKTPSKTTTKKTTVNKSMADSDSELPLYPPAMSPRMRPALEGVQPTPSKPTKQLITNDFVGAR